MPTVVNVYVDPDAAGTGSGADWTNAYTSLTACEADEVAGTGNITSADLVTNDEQLVINCRSSGGTADTGGRSEFAGWTTDATRNIIIQSADDHEGRWNTSAYRNIITDNFDANIDFQAGAEYAHVIGLQLQNDGPQTQNSFCIWGNTGSNTSSYFFISKNICRTDWVGTPSGAVGLIDFSSGDVNADIVNNICYGNMASGIAVGFANNVVRNIYNNTAYGTSNAPVGFYLVGNGTSTYGRNNIAAGSFSNAGFIITSLPTTQTNGSSDTSSPDGASYQSLSFSFTNAGAGDFTLTASTPEAGTDLSSDGTYAFSDDIQGETRSTWDLGADEYIAGSSSLAPLAARHLFNQQGQ